MEKRKKIQIMLDDLIQKKKRDAEMLVKRIQNSGHNREKLYKIYLYLLSTIKNNREMQIMAFGMIEAGGDTLCIMSAVEVLNSKEKGIKGEKP
jgi:hypothetical protein